MTNRIGYVLNTTITAPMGRICPDPACPKVGTGCPGDATGLVDGGGINSLRNGEAGSVVLRGLSIAGKRENSNG